MFNPKTKKIEKISELHQSEIDQLESFFTGDVGVYIDYANVRPWSVKLNWNIDLKRLKQFLDSFDNIKSVKFYDGTLKGYKDSEKSAELKKGIFKDGFKTKPVKIIHQSIDCTSIKSNSPDLLEDVY